MSAPGVLPRHHRGESSYREANSICLVSGVSLAFKQCFAKTNSLVKNNKVAEIGVYQSRYLGVTNGWREAAAPGIDLRDQGV